MTLDFLQVDVFADRAYAGNPLAVFYDAPGLSDAQMQSIAREMNLSETTFVTSAAADSYRSRIFTPSEELPFAGHPTIGTTWVLRHLGMVTAERVVQHTSVGETPVVERDGILWLERPGAADPDEGEDAYLNARVAEALGLEPSAVGADASVLGASGVLRPAFSNAGLRTLTVPLADVATLSACSPRPDLIAEVGDTGAYCYAPAGPGRVRARGFFPGVGVAEDPATGMAAAALGILLAERLGDIDFEIAQGVEMGRASRIFVRGRSAGTVEVGGRSELVLTGRVDVLPQGSS